jgi:ferredoxin
MPYVVTSECILCGACESGCESDAITEGDTQAHIDVNVCIECGTCERNCSSGAIVFMEDAEDK